MSIPEQHDFSPNPGVDDKAKRPDNRLTEEEKLDLQVIEAVDLADDSRDAIERNFPTRAATGLATRSNATEGRIHRIA